MRFVGVVAKELEGRAISHVGSFELFKFWHTFLQERTNPKNKLVAKYTELFKMGGRSKLLSSFSAGMTGQTIGRDYCRDLISHYDSL